MEIAHVRCPPFHPAYERERARVRVNGNTLDGKWVLRVVLFALFHVVYCIIAFAPHGGFSAVVLGPPQDDDYIAVGGAGNSFLYGCEKWRALSYLPLHAGLIHVLINMAGFISLAAILHKYDYSFCAIFCLYVFPALFAVVIVSRLKPLDVFVAGSAGTGGVIGCLIAQVLSDGKGMTRTALLVITGNVIVQALLGIHHYISIPLTLVSLVYGFSFTLFLLNWPCYRKWRHNQRSQLPTPGQASQEEAPQYTKRMAIYFVLSVLLVAIGVFFSCQILWTSECPENRGHRGPDLYQTPPSGNQPARNEDA